MTNEEIKNKVVQLVDKYDITHIVLFGSRANGTNTETSDVDLIVEFGGAMSLIKLASLKYELEDLLGLSVDVIHGPIRETDMIEIGDTIELYAA